MPHRSPEKLGLVKLDDPEAGKYSVAYQWRVIRLSAMTKKRKPPVVTPVEYHVVPNGNRWDVEREAMFIGSFAYDVNTAIGLATAAARRDQHNGLDVMVCVQEPDGTCRKVWP
jgi:hypothetical protein